MNATRMEAAVRGGECGAILRCRHGLAAARNHHVLEPGDACTVSRAEAIGRSPQSCCAQKDGGLGVPHGGGDGRWSGELTQQTRDGRQGSSSRHGADAGQSGRGRGDQHPRCYGTPAGQAKLRESELFYRQTLESIPGMVFTTRPDGYCDYHSQQWEDYTGVPTSQQVGTNWNKLLHPDDQAGAYAAWRAAVEERGSYDVEYRVRRRDGQYEWFNVKGRPIRDSSGQIVRWFGVATNINDLKRSAEALHRGAQNLQLLSKTATRLLMEDSPKEARAFFPGCPPIWEWSCSLFLVSEMRSLILQAPASTMPPSGGCSRPTSPSRSAELWLGSEYRRGRGRKLHDPAAALIRSLGLTALPAFAWRGRLVGTLGFGTRSQFINPDDGCCAACPTGRDGTRTQAAGYGTGAAGRRIGRGEGECRCGHERRGAG